MSKLLSKRLKDQRGIYAVLTALNANTLEEMIVDAEDLEKHVEEQDKSLESLDKIIKLLFTLVFDAKEKVDEAKGVIKSCLVLLKKSKK